MRGEIRISLMGAVCAAAGAVGGMGGVAAAQSYRVQDLGTLGYLGDTQAFALSRHGTSPRVVGFATEPSHALRGFLGGQGGPLQPIAPLAPDTQSIAYGIDGQDRAVGVMYQLGEIGTHAFRFDGTTLTPLGDFTPRGANGAGDVAGYTMVMETQGFATELVFDHACVYRSGVLTDLGTLGAAHWSRAYAINDAGHLAGCSGAADDSGSRAVVWMNGAPGTAIDIGTLGGSEACGYAINASNTVVGYSTLATSPPQRVATAWELNGAGQVMQRVNLGALPPDAPGVAPWSYAYGVNTRGAIVGTSNGHGFIYDHGVMTDLNTTIPAGSGWFIAAARAINDSDLIAAWGVDSLNEPHPLLLIPCVADFNRDGTVSVQDIFDFLAAYFSGHPRADISGDGTVSVQDIFDYLAAYFSGC